MTEIGHRYIETNGIRMHIAEAGSGPLVLGGDVPEIGMDLVRDHPQLLGKVAPRG